MQQASGAPARSSHRTRCRVMFPLLKTPLAHAHGSGRATFWPSPPAARTQTSSKTAAAQQHQMTRAAAQMPCRLRNWWYSNHVDRNYPPIALQTPGNSGGVYGCNTHRTVRSAGRQPHAFITAWEQLFFTLGGSKFLFGEPRGATSWGGHINILAQE